MLTRPEPGSARPCHPPGARVKTSLPSRPSRGGLALLALILLAWPSMAGAAQILDQIAAVVNDEIVFLSDVERYLVFFAPPDQRQPPDASPPPLDSALMKSALRDVTDEALLAAEARRFGTELPSEADAEKAVQKIGQGFASEESFRTALRRYSATPESFLEEVRTRLLVDRFIDQRIRFFIFVTPEDVERYYAEHREQFGGQSLDSAKEAISQEITDQRTRVRLEDYLGRLRSRATVRSNL